MQVNEALRIDGFDAETQHAFDKLAAYLAVFKHRANPASPRYVTKLNEFQLKFMEFMDKAPTNRAKLQVKSYISEIQNLLDAAVTAPPKEKKVNLGGGKLRKVKAEKEPVVYANPNDGGEYYDGDVHVYEAPVEEDDPEVAEDLKTLRKAGARVSR